MRKLILLTTALALVVILPGYSTLPVIDYSVLTQSIQQGLRQIQQYTTELNQLETQIGMYRSQLLSAAPSQYTSQSAGYWSTTQQTANDQMVKEITQQESQIQADAQTLQRLQSQAGSVATQRQALDVANEMAGLEQKSLLEIRTLLVSEQQALAARNGSIANEEAMKQAATQQYFGVQFAPQNHTGW